MEGLGCTRGKTQLWTYSIWLSGNGCSYGANANRTTTNVELFSTWLGVDFHEGDAHVCKVLQRMCKQQLPDALSHVPGMDPQMLQVGWRWSNA